MDAERTNYLKVAAAAAALPRASLRWSVLNTRLKAAPILGVTPSAAPTTMGGMLKHVVATEGAGALFAGLVPRAAIFGLGSGVFWGCYSHTRRILGLENLAR